MKAPLPENERDRLASLARYNILDTSPELAYDRITALTSRLFAAPTALVSLVDEKRQWFKSACGLNIRQTNRDLAFCAYTLLENRVLCVPDCLKDARFADNALVTGAPEIRFYAGAPLRDPEGLALGTLCIIDYTPRSDLSDVERANLCDLAALVMDELEMRKTAHSLAEANRKLAALATTDPLTSLPNRLRFERELQLLLSREPSAQVAVFYIDLDRFKAVNDSLGGHAAGDSLLCHLSARLAKQMPEGGLLARIGGDEFIATMQINNIDAAKAIAESLCRAARKDVQVGKQCFSLGASIGISLYPFDGRTVAELVRQADRAMYEAKRSGGSCFHLATEAQREQYEQGVLRA